MKCPSCKDAPLLPTELDYGLVCAGCKQCSGALLSLINYRYWLSQMGDNLAEQQQPSDVCLDDSKNAKLCPKCNRFMTKYKIAAESENRVELCSHCDEVWLDSGEWNLLKSLSLHDDLNAIFTESWQRRIRQNKEAKRWNEHFSSLIGVEEFKKVSVFKAWLDAQPHTAEIKHYLTTNFNEGK